MHDVAIIGAGPTGLLAAALLGGAGHDVLLIERHAEPYPLPRAVRFDHEVMRIWQRLGIADAMLAKAIPIDSYEWYGADDQLIVSYHIPPSPSGWPFSFTFNQPDLEDELLRIVEQLNTVTVRRGYACVDLGEVSDQVHITLSPFDGRIQSIDASIRTSATARYLIGADGAGSTVRQLLGVSLEDSGFRERWLVLDVLPRDAEVAARLPPFPMQFCKPARPHMLCPSGRRLRRWEFMLLPDETAADFDDAEKAWSLLSAWLRPDEGTFVRRVVYEFGAAVAESLRAGRRSFLIGDAGHLMPPHLGEGMCSGLRDANALAWRLDLVLRGITDETPLDSYSSERLPHATELVDQSLAMGRISCERDPVLAAERDRRLRARGGMEPWPFPRLGPGLAYKDSAAAQLIGHVGVQGVVDNGRRQGLLDDVIGGGFAIIATRAHGLHLSPTTARAFQHIGGHIVALDELNDVDGRLTEWLATNEVDAIIVRPDFYVFGAVRELDATQELVDSLLDQLGVSETAAITHN